MKVNIGLCLVGVIIGEFLCANAGLGYLIIYASQVFKMDLLVMSIVILCLALHLSLPGDAWIGKKAALLARAALFLVSFLLSNLLDFLQISS